jgi:hypothetical protein
MYHCVFGSEVHEHAKLFITRYSENSAHFMKDQEVYCLQVKSRLDAIEQQDT